MAAKARQQYYADWEYIDKQAREFQPTMEFKTKIDSIEPGAQVNIIEDIKVNWTSLEVDDKTVDISIPLVIDNLYSIDWVNALSAKQGKVLYDLVQNLASRGRYLSNWNAATWLPTTNPVESHYQYRAWDYYVVSSVAAQWGTNYRPEPGEFVIWQASVTVETEVVKVTDMYLYDGSNWNLLINSTREIPIDSSLSTSSTNPVENRVVTNAINGKQDTLVAWNNIQIANDWKTISATDTTYTAWANISIDANNEISAVDTTYTAWANVQISNSNVISATDTVYSEWTGIDITNNIISNEWVLTVNGGNWNVIVNDVKVSPTAPASPIEWQLWYDTTNDVLKTYDGTNWNATGKTYTAWDGIDIVNDEISVDVTDIIGTWLSEDANNNIIVDTTVVATQTDLSWKQDKATSGSTAPSTTPSYIWQQYIDTTNDKMYVATGTSSSSDWTEVGAWSWDMLYSDFNWVTKTWATITLDLRSEITPSADFTVNKPSTLEDWQYYILRVISWATAYTMTLWTNVTNPYSEDLTLETNTIQQFTFLAKGWNLELQPSSAGVVYTAWTWITISNDEISADTTVLATKTDLSWKQDTLTAWTNIQISNNVISATDTTYTAWANVQISNSNVISATDTTYTAWTNIDITNDVISADTQFVLVDTLPSVSTADENKIYILWPIWTGADKYEEYIVTEETIPGHFESASEISHWVINRSYDDVSWQDFPIQIDWQYLSNVYLAFNNLEGENFRIVWVWDWSTSELAIDLTEVSLPYAHNTLIESPIWYANPEEPAWYSVTFDLYASSSPLTWVPASTQKVWTKIWETSVDLSDLNTKTFYLASTSDLTTATAALQWYFAGKNAIIVYRWYAYMIWTTGSSSPLVFISTIAISRSSSSPVTENWIKNLQIFFDSSHNATVIHDSNKYNSQSFLETNYNYSTPYTPQYAGSPATKKYVDDNVVQKSDTAPSNPVEWTVWYDTTNDILKAYDWTQWNVVWNWDMAYADFNWVTKTWATVTLDFNSVIEPSANFTVNAPSTIKDWQIYILRVESGATAYTMTLGTWITNPYSESTTLTANKIKLFTFLAIDGSLELQPSVQWGSTYTAGNGIDITNDVISIDTDVVQEKVSAWDWISIWSASYRNNQWPCQAWFHVPTKAELQKLKSYWTTAWAWASDWWGSLSAKLNIPLAWALWVMDWTPGGQWTIWVILACDWETEYDTVNCYSMQIAGSMINVSNDMSWQWYNVRPFKDTPVAPDSSWIVVYQWTWSAWVFHNTTLWLISISGNGTDWITIADKNVWATVVWNSWDTLSANNVWNFYQWWNNYWFPFSWASTTSSTQVDATGYWPGNYYSSDTFITDPTWQTSKNLNLWWWVNPTWTWTQSGVISNTWVLSFNWNTWNVSWLQISPDSPLTPKYVWYWTQAQYDALSQYYTDEENDTVYFTI